MQDLVTGDELLERLRHHLDTKQSKNKRFTASALARQIGILDTTLHKLLRGERKLGQHLGKQIADYLEVSYKHEVRRKKQVPSRALKPNAIPGDLTWLHLAVLELISLSDFEPSSHYVSRKLGFTQEKAEALIGELCASGLLEISDEETWIDHLSASAVAAKQFVTSNTLRELQREMNLKSIEALDAVPYDVREHAATFVALDPKVVPELKRKFRNFRWEIAQWIESSSADKSELYVIQTNTFPLTQLTKRTAQ